jgi:hypothetical protein
MMEVNTIAIDLAKNVFALCAANAAGRILWRKELRRTQLLGFMRQLAPVCSGWKRVAERTTGRVNSVPSVTRCD